LFKQQGGNLLLSDLKDAIQVNYNHITISFDKSTSSSLTFITFKDSASTFAIFKDSTSNVQTPVLPGITQADLAEGLSQVT
jgi:hypothetical protein